MVTFTTMVKICSTKVAGQILPSENFQLHGSKTQHQYNITADI